MLILMQNKVDGNDVHALEYAHILPELKYARSQLNVYVKGNGKVGGNGYGETQIRDIGEKLNRPETQKMLLTIGPKGHAMLLRRSARLESDRHFPLESFDAAQGDNDRLIALLRGWQPAPEAKVKLFIDRVEATLGPEGLNILRQYSRSDAVRAYVDQIW